MARIAPKAVSGKVDAGFPFETATRKESNAFSCFHQT
jgi:hypothetical protein